MQPVGTRAVGSEDADFLTLNLYVVSPLGISDAVPSVPYIMAKKGMSFRSKIVFIDTESRRPLIFWNCSQSRLGAAFSGLRP